MKTYEQYLVENEYATSSILSYLCTQRLFLLWVDHTQYDVLDIDYKACLEYVKYIQQSRNGKIPKRRTTQANIGVIKSYFNYLIDTQQRYDNPMQGMNIRGVKRSLNHNLLSIEELEDLFYSFQTQNINPPACPHIALRDKIIVGLMVYQGLNITSIKALCIKDVDVNKGSIYVPGTRITNGRHLKIKSPQVLPLARYLQESMEVLQKKIKCDTAALIPLSGERFDVITRLLFKKLRQFNFKTKNSRQIRASVITYWLKHHNLREVQYMAGHRYISSTERYVHNDLENLQEVIENLHPIG